MQSYSQEMQKLMFLCELYHIEQRQSFPFLFFLLGADLSHLFKIPGAPQFLKQYFKSSHKLIELLLLWELELELCIIVS